MKHGFLSFTVAVVLGLAPAFADDTNTTTSIAPSNAQYVSPVTNSTASTANVSTQINNNNLGANSFGQGIVCQSPQVAVGGYGSRQSVTGSIASTNTGVSLQYLTPVGTQSTRACQNLANEVLHQRQIDTQLTFVQRCADFQRAGIVLDPQIYPELARQCAGIRLSPGITGNAPGNAFPRNANGVTGAPVRPVSMVTAPRAARKAHLSDFSPQNNYVLRNLASRRLSHIALLQAKSSTHALSHKDRTEIAARLQHENASLRAVIAEYKLEATFLRKIADDPSWHKKTQEASARLVSYQSRG